MNKRFIGTMKIQCYRIAEQRHLESVETESVFEAIRTGEFPLWVDIEAGGKKAFDDFLSNIQLNPVMAQCCREAGGRSRAIPTPDAIFFEFPVYTREDTSDTTSLSILCLRNLMVTIHPVPIQALDTLAVHFESPSPLLPLSSISTLVLLLLLNLSEENLGRLMEVRRGIDRLDEIMDHDPELVTLKQILVEKDTIRSMDAVNEESGVVFDYLKAVSSAQLDLAKLGTYYQLVLSNTENLTRSIDRLESRMIDLNQRFVVHMQDKTNHRLALLTIISAIFLPLTLLTGIYGMNFDAMPELHLRYAYPVFLGAIAIIALALWRYFKRNGWIG